MALMCNKCFTIHENVLKEFHREIRDCSSNEIVEIDDLFALPIRILNQKGYTTKLCCSGHYVSREMKISNSYLRFLDDIRLLSLPSGYVYDYDNPTIIFLCSRRSRLDELLNQ